MTNAHLLALVQRPYSFVDRIGTIAPLQSRGQRSAPGDDRSSAKPAASRSGQANLPVPGVDRPRRHATVIMDAAGPSGASPAHWISPPLTAEVARPAREARAVYEGFDPEVSCLENDF
jgi:hypothetical protein